ncbi:MAG: hypothetical protein J0653_01230, partial [Deltaproteobacteria bacterium]|nr:hypothetical protein [Deltaproteobacteria bacterium]
MKVLLVLLTFLLLPIATSQAQQIQIAALLPPKDNPYCKGVDKEVDRLALGTMLLLGNGVPPTLLYGEADQSDPSRSIGPKTVYRLLTDDSIFGPNATPEQKAIALSIVR